MTDLAALPCVFVPAHEPWSCSTHHGGYRVSLNETACRTAQAATVEAMTPEEVAEFDHWAEGRRGRGVSLGMLWALRLRATLAAGVRVAGEPDYAGHRTDEPHDCFLMNCKGLRREVESLRAAAAAPRSEDAAPLACGVCLYTVGGVAAPAITIIESYAVCEDHTGVVAQGMNFASIRRAALAEPVR